MANDVLRLDALPIAKSDASRVAMPLIPKFAALLPSGLAQQYAFACLSELNKLPDCTNESCVLACYHAALLGLVPGATLGMAHFIPYRKKGQEKRNAQLIVGYKGYVELAIASGFIADLHTDVVLEGEPFEYRKTEEGPKLNHVVGIRDEYGKPAVLAAYCIYHTRGGGKGIKVVSRKEIDKVDKGQDVWVTNYPAMAMKTAIRRAAREWPIFPRLALAMRIDERYEDGADEIDLPVLADAPKSDEPMDLSAVPEPEA